MADIEVGDLVARITLDDTGLDKSMAQIQREMKLVASEFEKASASLQAYGSEEDKLRTKSDQLTKQIALQGQKVELLRQEFQKSAQEKGEDAVATQKLATQLNKAETAMARMQVELKQVNKELADQPSRMQKWSSGLQDIGNRLQAAGAEIAASFGLAGAAVAAGLGVAVKTAADFEAQMDRVGAIAEASAAELQAMSDTAMELGASTSKSASEVAQGMEMMAAMGFKVNEIIAAMPGVISAAEASGEDMALVADTMAVSIRAFGMEANQSTHVADVLAKTANISAANLEGMAYALKYAAAPAHTLGMSLEEVSAAVAIMSDAGIRGETAGTTLRMALTRLVKPTDETREVLNLLGVKINDTNGKMLPFANIIGQLQQKMSGLSNSQKAAYLATIFGVEAMSGMMTVVEAGPAKFQALTKELENSSGASADAAAKMKDNLKGAIEQLSGAFETAQVTIGNALIPIIQSLAGAVQGVVDWFNQLDPSMQEFVALSTAAGATLLVLVGTFGAVMAAVGLAASGLGALGLSLSAVGAVILPVTAAIAGLTAAGILLYQNWETIKAYAIQVWGSISAFVTPIVQEITGFITEKFTYVSEWWHEIWPNMLQAFQNVWSAILTVITPILSGIVTAFQAAWPVIQEITIATWEGLKGVISGALEVIMGIINAFVGLLTGNWNQVWGGLQQAAIGFWDGIKSIFQAGTSSLWILLGDAWKYIQERANHVWTGISQFFMQTWSEIESTAAAIWDKIKYGVELTVGAIVGLFLPSLVKLGMETTAQAARVTAAWIAMKVEAIATSTAHAVQAIPQIISSFVKMSIEATVQMGKVVASWAMMGVEAIKQAALQVAQIGKIIAQWVLLGAQSLAQAARMAAAWVIAMGPIAWVTAAVVGLTTLIIANWETIKAKTIEIWNSITKWVSDSWASLSQKAVEFGRNLVEGLWNGISSLSGWIKQQVLSFVESIGTTIKDFFGIASPSRLMAEYGGYLVEGLWQGIQNMSTWIQGKVTEFASGIANSIKSFFGIASPSRLMMEYGGYISEGLAVGMRQNEQAVAAAAKAQADIVRAKTQEAKDVAVAHWKEMNLKVKTEADLMAQAIYGALERVRTTTQLELAISKQEFELFAATLGTTTADQAKKLEAQMELLRIELDTSKETVEVLNKAYDDMVKVKGANTEEAQKLYLELLKEQTAYQGIKNELANIEEQIKKTTAAQKALTYESGKWYEIINGAKVQVGGGKGGVSADDPIYGPGGAWGDMPDWLKPKPGGGSDDKGNNSGRDATDPRDKDYSNDDRYVWDGKEGRWWDNEDGGWEGGDVFGRIKSEAKTSAEKAEKSIRDSIKDVFDKVKESFRFPGLATGGTVTGSGWTWVGEDGPELLKLPRGSQVIPNYDAPRFGGGAIDYDALARAMARYMKPSITQHNTFNSPQPLSPSETARKNQQVSRQLALEWGL